MRLRPFLSQTPYPYTELGRVSRWVQGWDEMEVHFRRFPLQNLVPEPDVHEAAEFAADLGEVRLFDEAETFVQADTPFVRQGDTRHDRVDLLVFFEQAEKFLIKAVTDTALDVLGMYIYRKFRRSVPRGTCPENIGVTVTHNPTVFFKAEPGEMLSYPPYTVRHFLNGREGFFRRESRIQHVMTVNFKQLRRIFGSYKTDHFIFSSFWV